MKVHKYELTDYHSFVVGETVLLETRLYVPNYHTVLICRERDRDSPNFNVEIVRTSTDSRDIDQAKRCIVGSERSNAKYLGVVELPDDVVFKVISTGKSLEKAKLGIRDSSRRLSELI